MPAQIKVKIEHTTRIAAWSVVQDRLLLVQRWQGTKIAELNLPNKTPANCAKRWTRFLRGTEHRPGSTEAADRAEGYRLLQLLLGEGPLASLALWCYRRRHGVPAEAVLTVRRTPEG